MMDSVGVNAVSALSAAVVTDCITNPLWVRFPITAVVCVWGGLMTRGWGCFLCMLVVGRTPFGYVEPRLLAPAGGEQVVRMRLQTQYLHSDEGIVLYR
jgi:hypothetical protein